MTTDAGAPRDAGEWLRTHGVTVAAITLIVIQLWWKAALLAHSYFRQDDYYTFDRALAHGLSWKYLMLVDAGHMAPLGFAISWVLARVSLYNWPLTCVVILAFLAAASFALLRVLRTLFGSRPAILIPLVVYLFSPLSLAGVAWWSVAIETLPLELAIFMAVHAHVRYLREGRARSAVAAASWLLLGLVTIEKGAVIPPLLLALTSAFFVEGRWAASTVTAVRRYWKAWVLYGVLLAGYCAVFFLQLPGSSTQPSGPGPASRLAELASTLVGTTLLPGALGGPWHWSVLGFGYAQASPPAALQQLSWAVAGLVVVVSCVCRPRAWRAWTILLGWIIVADIVPVVLGRLGTQPATLLGVQTRYLTDATPVLALCIGLAFLPLTGEENAFRFRLAAPVPTALTVMPAGTAARTAPAAARSIRATTLLILGAFLIGSFWSFQSLEAAFSTASARSYIATARAAVADAPRGTLIVDQPTPAMLMDPGLFQSEGYTSQVIGALARREPARRLSWTLSPRGAARNLMIFDAQGQLRPAILEGPSSGPPPAPKPAARTSGKTVRKDRGKTERKASGKVARKTPVKAPARACWAVTPAGTNIPLHGSLYRWPWSVRLDFSGPATGPATVLAVRFGARWTDVTLPAGAHAVYVPAVGAGRAVGIRAVGPAAGLCVTDVTVGSLHPQQAGQAIPAVPVPG
jgi:hypothetical protein